MRGMLNIEKYKDKLIELGVIKIRNLAIEKGKPRTCKTTACRDCKFLNNNTDSCKELAVK
ncbi:hypothetical protein [Eubacterium sp.]|uniref:hypothetical protein n=1 Tax=Eubacterium sp. TaxID=142586 RepID=UPI001D32FEE2|nr:hypothetical protein [Eubacterium sp.]MBS5620922.1 hypothetical protein [Eubacterium sp.]